MLLYLTLYPATQISLTQSFFFSFNDTATTEIYTLSLHDALPISSRERPGDRLRPAGRGGRDRRAAPGDQPERGTRCSVPRSDPGRGRGDLSAAGRGVPGVGAGADLRGRNRGPVAVQPDAHEGPHRKRNARQPAARVGRPGRGRCAGRPGLPGPGFLHREEDHPPPSANSPGGDGDLSGLRPPLRGGLGAPAGSADRGGRHRPEGRGARGPSRAQGAVDRQERASAPVTGLLAATVRLPFLLFFGAFLFSCGVYGVLARRNAVLVLMSIELMLNAVNVNLVAFSAYLKQLTGQVFALFVITVAAAEIGIGLAIVILIYRNRETINVDEISLLKW